MGEGREEQCYKCWAGAVAGKEKAGNGCVMTALTKQLHHSGHHHILTPNKSSYKTERENTFNIQKLNMQLS